MLTYEFVSEKLHSGTFVKRPKVLIRLVGKKTSIEFWALLDSGSDISMIPKDIADSVGIDYDKNEGEKVYGFEKDAFSCANCKMDLIFKSPKNSAEERLNNVPALIMLTDIENDVILGCEGIFDQFKIIFDRRNKIIMRRVKTKNR